MLGEVHWLKQPTLARHHITICMTCFTTGGPGKEQGTNKPPPTRRVRERSKGDTMYLTTSPNPSVWHPCWLNKEGMHHQKDSESEWLAKDNLEINPITIKPESRAVLLGSLTLLLSARVPSINKVSLSAHVSSHSSFLSVRQEAALGALGEGAPLSTTEVE